MKLAAALLVCAAAAMAVAAFATGGDGEEQPAAIATATPVAGGPDGRAVWVEYGCGSCHTLAAANSAAMFGPDLEESLEGMPADYVRESIVDPNKVAAAGYSTGSMPEDFGERIPPAELDALVAFIRGAAAQE